MRVALAFVFVAACAGKTTSSPTSTSSVDVLHACDPLASVTSPITLDTVIAAGRAADGTVYVVDHDPSASKPTDFRVFVSDGSVLQRQIVTISVLGPQGPQIAFGPSEDGQQITVALTNGVAMAILFQSTGKQETVPLIAASELSSYAVANYTLPWTVDYDVASDDGHRADCTATPDYTLSRNGLTVPLHASSGAKGQGLTFQCY